MKYCVVMASPRKNGNTVSITDPFIEELQKAEAEVDYISLYEKDLKPCLACRTCQDVFDGFGCPIEDDMQDIYDRIEKADCLVLATPIYAWYCTAPMKAMLDRIVYGINKFYGKEPGPARWSGKKVAIITTCGYRPEKGADIFEEGVKRYCKHSKLDYIGMLAVRDPGYKSVFINDEKIEQAKAFARELERY